MLYLTCTSCLDWRICEDIRARTVKGCLSWTGRRYQAGTLRGRPNWFGSLLPEVQGTSSWFISWMLEQQEDQAQSVKSSSSIESRAELKCRMLKYRIAQAQIKCSVQDKWLSAKTGTSAVIEFRSDHQRCTIYLAERPAEGPAG
ncbi:hypothetical protein F511_09490 [Dorcoceras hygrometricum]|uniref:Uncharacterized protein n=1 Tax=Dorcoceras hygrometricum TaxID=472368 RepID=A0A2Z7BQR0_9LAMI|nr:hypothetical protein F511_09490 [Dorcoceras hygrometricum]